MGNLVRNTSENPCLLTPGAQSWSIVKAIVDYDGYLGHHQPVAGSQIHNKRISGSSQGATSLVQGGGGGAVGIRRGEGRK